MNMRPSVRLLGVTLLSLGLITGCATTDESTGPSATELATKAISDAKAANAEAKAINYEWRDTGKIIAAAEKKLAAGDTDGAMTLANKAKSQANIAVSQANVENKKFLDSNTVKYVPVKANAFSGAKPGRVDSYSVDKGDNLWKISGKEEVYANPYQWPLIYKTNRSQIKDADLIYPGQVLDIDQNASASEIDAAVNHAKTRGAWSIGDSERTDSLYLSK